MWSMDTIRWLPLRRTRRGAVGPPGVNRRAARGEPPAGVGEQPTSRRVASNGRPEPAPVVPETEAAVVQREADRIAGPGGRPPDRPEAADLRSGERTAEQPPPVWQVLRQEAGAHLGRQRDDAGHDGDDAPRGRRGPPGPDRPPQGGQGPRGRAPTAGLRHRLHLLVDALVDLPEQRLQGPLGRGPRSPAEG